MVETNLFSDYYCICCQEPKQPHVWFCEKCTEVKEQAYAESRRLGEKTFEEVITRRDAALAKRMKR